MMDNLPSVPQIRAARALIGWTQDDLAAASGKSKRTIAKVELGNADVKAQTFKALADALEAAGIVFIADAVSEGVVLRRRD